MKDMDRDFVHIKENSNDLLKEIKYKIYNFIESPNYNTNNSQVSAGLEKESCLLT